MTRCKSLLSKFNPMAKLNRDELIRLVQHIMTTSGCVVDLDALLNEFESNVKLPQASELIFNPPDGYVIISDLIGLRGDTIGTACANSPDFKK